MPKKILLITLLTLILAGGIAATGIYIGKKLAQPQEDSFTLPSIEPEEIAPEISPSEPSEIDTSNWKIYRNEKYGFEVRYPENWEILHEGYYREKVPYEVSFTRKNLGGPRSVPIAILIHIETLENAKETSGYVVLKFEKEIVVNGIESKKQVRMGPEGEYEAIFIPLEKNLIYELAYSNPEFRGTFHQMVSTFRFIK